MFDAYDNNFNFTAYEIFRQQTPPAGLKCCVQMNINEEFPY